MSGSPDGKRLRATAFSIAVPTFSSMTGISSAGVHCANAMALSELASVANAFFSAAGWTAPTTIAIFSGTKHLHLFLIVILFRN